MNNGFYPALTGSKTPTSSCKKNEKISGRSTARKSPIE
ncbi:spermidine/putrescine ABC transporter ATP-binding protein [Psychrobacillus lasiicapitis]|uniref:Spermidine/putrescine ABC transporter ATP-binding protein n=1 Tax=Psychrobacillus lasiicapitis TaxID=1636719 RepID=A0A544T246_9BACI|nr:spermidine/putrescine ABC transporter ATP-binding protein [Psychrobacillus lasiicapitis]